MHSVIHQSVVLPATVERLFAAFLDPATHAAITGQPVEIEAHAGAKFGAFGGQLSGQILAVVQPRLIVQSWRSVKFHDSDADSTLILTFTPEGPAGVQGRIDLVHIDVPEHDYQDVVEGWTNYYWTPWRIFLEQQHK